MRTWFRYARALMTRQVGDTVIVLASGHDRRRRQGHDARPKALASSNIFHVKDKLHRSHRLHNGITPCSGPGREHGFFVPRSASSPATVYIAVTATRLPREVTPVKWTVADRRRRGRVTSYGR